jgi:DNA repair photolyase
VDALEKDAAKLNGDKRPILLSFTSDIYQPADDKFRLSRLTLLSLKRNNLVATVLTKGGTRACKDFDILKQNSKNAFSVTLTTDDDAESSKWEPGAALPADRIESLKKAHAAGIKTWVSFEPVINPDAVIRLIETTRGFVDLYKVGLLNYHPHSKTIDWIKFRLSAIETLQRYNKPYYIKKDLRDLKQRSPW